MKNILTRESVCIFSTRPSDKIFLESANQNFALKLLFFEVPLNQQTAPLAKGCTAVSAFVNDRVDDEVLAILAEGGTKILALRCAGANNVDLKAAERHNIKVTRVPEYSPYAVAEHTLAMIMALNRKIYRSYSRVREGNFSLEGLLGFDMHQKTVGVIGTGKIGRTFLELISGFGCRRVAFDPYPDLALSKQGIEYLSFEDLIKTSDVISLHCPLTPHNFHMISKNAIGRMKSGVMLINTGRGGLIDTRAVIGGLKSGKIAYLGLDVYEEEGPLFFEDRSDTVISDDVFARLLTFPNVLITGHQAYFTKEALEQISLTTLESIDCFLKGRPLKPSVVVC